MKKLFTMLAVVALFAACCGNNAKKAGNACTDNVECAAAADSCCQKEECACCKDTECACCKEEGAECTCDECTCCKEECTDACCQETVAEEATAEVAAE